jgi:hypothetical protein
VTTLTDIEDLTRRLAALEAERDILQTLNRYGHTIGLGDEAGWLDLFEPDGVFEIHRRDFGAGDIAHPHPDQRKGAANGPTVYDGRDQLVRFISRHPHPPARYHKHTVLDSVVTLDGTDAADVASFFIRLDAGPDGAPHVTAFGRYIDRMRRGADGRWRFAHRRCNVESRGPDPF